MGLFPTLTGARIKICLICYALLPHVPTLFGTFTIGASPARSTELPVEEAISKENTFGTDVWDLSRDEAISLIDSLQTEVQLNRFIGNYKLAEENDSIQLELGKIFYEKSGDSSFLEVTRALERKLNLSRLNRMRMIHGSFDRNAQIDSLLAVRDVYVRHGLRTQELTTDLLLGELYIAFARADCPKALARFLNALTIAREENLHSWEAHSLIGLARLFKVIKRDDIAREYFEKAREIGERIEDPIVLYRALYGLARIELAIGDPAVAYRKFMEARELSTTVFLRRDDGTIHYALGEAMRKMGDMEAALGELNRAKEWAQEKGFEIALLDISFSIGQIYEETGSLEDAKELYEEIIYSAADSCMSSSQWNAALRLGIMAEREGYIQDAMDWYRNAISCLEFYRGKMGLEELKLPFLENKMLPYERLIGLLYRASRGSQSKGKTEEMALEYCERSRMRSFLDVCGMKPPWPEAEVEEELVGKERLLLQRVNQLRMRLISGSASASDREMALKEIEDLKLALVELRLSRELSTSKDAAGSGYPDILMLDDVRKKILDPGTCILEYFVGDESSFAWLLEQDGIRMVELPQLSHEYRPAGLYIDLLSQGDQPHSSIGKRLYRDLIGPFEDDILSKSSLIIVPDGALNYLPFESLAIDNGSHTGDDIKYLIDEFEISYAPSISTLLALLDRPASRSGSRDRILALGDPVNGEETGFLERFVGAITAGREDEQLVSSSISKAWAFPRLKKSGDEVKRIAAMFPEDRRTVLLGKEAHEAAFKKLPLDEYQIIHFATHGIYDDQSPEFSGLLFSRDPDRDGEDGLLVVDEISQMKLSASLVVLSGCETGLGNYVRGEGVVGLTRAFLTAGVSSAVVSLWEVDDERTADFMEEFYRGYRSGLAKREALSAAKRRMRRKGKNSTEWAPFVLTGDYR